VKPDKTLSEDLISVTPMDAVISLNQIERRMIKADLAMGISVEEMQEYYGGRLTHAELELLFEPNAHKARRVLHCLEMLFLINLEKIKKDHCGLR